MDLFRYPVTGSWLNGRAINDFTEVTWIERYLDPGEFVIRAPLSSGLKTLLALDTVISHIDTTEAMIVESISLSETSDEEPMLEISGRSLTSIFENRVIGGNQNWTLPPATIPQIRYGGASSYVFNAAMSVLRNHGASDGIYADPINVGDEFANTEVLWDVLNFVVGAYSAERPLKRGEVLKQVLDWLKIMDYGLRVTRPRPYYTSNNMGFQAYDGRDKTQTVRFSAQTGDVRSADYLWTNKDKKNAALVSGKFVETMVYGAETSYARRTMFVDANDIDGTFTSVPTSGTTPTLAQVRADMAERGRIALANQKDVVLASATLTDDQSYRYRIDYDVGDIVSLDSSFGETLHMRVVEYAEIMDENGTSGYPTLAAYNP